MRVIVVDKNQFVDCIEDVIQTQLFVNDKLVIEKSDLKLSFIPLANISSIGCQDLTDSECKKENMKLKKIINNYGKFAGLTLREFYEKQNQDKINLLERIKKYFAEPFDDEGCFKTVEDVVDFIDELIQELEEE